MTFSTTAIFRKIHAFMWELSTGAGQILIVLIMFCKVLGQAQFHEEQADLPHNPMQPPELKF